MDAPSKVRPSHRHPLSPPPPSFFPPTPNSTCHSRELVDPKMQRPEPPTTGSRAEAQAQIESNKNKIQSLTESITSSEEELTQIIKEYRSNIDGLKKTKQELEEQVSLTLAYISPIRTLPHELLRHIFLLNFEDQPCCAWGLAAVCSLWRRLVLAMPRMWSKVRSKNRRHLPKVQTSCPVFIPPPFHA